MTDRLRECPCCGGEAKREGCLDSRWIICTKCGLMTRIFPTIEEAIEEWNTRKPMDRIVERLEERIDFHTRLVDYEMNMGTIVDVERHKEAIKTTEKAIEIVKEGGKDVTTRNDAGMD